jgi:hypothetical protein
MNNNKCEYCYFQKDYFCYLNPVAVRVDERPMACQYFGRSDGGTIAAAIQCVAELLQNISCNIDDISKKISNI